MHDVGRRAGDGRAQIAANEDVLDAAARDARVAVKPLDDGRAARAGGEERVAPSGERGVARQQRVGIRQRLVERVVHLNNRHAGQTSFHLKRRPTPYIVLGGRPSVSAEQQQLRIRELRIWNSKFLILRAGCEITRGLS